MFTTTKIISYVFFAFALVAFITNCVVAGSPNRDWTKTFVNEVSYSVAEVTETKDGDGNVLETVEDRTKKIKKQSNTEYKYTVPSAYVYVPKKIDENENEVAGDRTFVIVLKTKIEQTKAKWKTTYESTTVTDIHIKNGESMIAAYKSIRDKYVTDSEKNAASAAIESMEASIETIKSQHREENRAKSIADTNRFWSPTVSSWIPINHYLFLTLLCGTAGAFFFLKKDKGAKAAK